MSFLKRLLSKLSESTDNTRNDNPYGGLVDEDTAAGEWYVFRYKNGKWSKFGKPYLKEYMAFNAMIDWQSLFPNVEFKTGKEAPHACSKCH